MVIQASNPLPRTATEALADIIWQPYLSLEGRVNK
jgi:hypothetical protein